MSTKILEMLKFFSNPRGNIILLIDFSLSLCYPVIVSIFLANV